MNLKYIICLVTVAMAATSCKHNDKPVLTKQLHQLLEQKDYFRLDRQFQAVGNELTDSDRLYYKAFIDNAFNRNTECINDVDSLLSSKDVKPSDSIRYVLRSLQGDSYFKTFQYAKAAQCDSDILKTCKNGLHKETIDDVNNDLIIRNGLKETPAQLISINSNTTFNWTKDKLGLIEIPVSTASPQTFDAIFDTRANISSITQSYAKKLGLRMLNVSYNEGSGATGIQFKTGMGIADSLRIGSIQFKNVVFQVMPDSILYIAPVKFQLNIIIGFPVIAQMGEVHISNKGTMTIPLNPTHKGLHNFALDGLDPVISLISGRDTLPFHFDSGASSSVFYANYFNRYKSYILKNGIKKTVGFGGAGGVQKRQVYMLPKVALGLAGKTVTIDSVDIRMEKIVPGEVYYGNIGQDFIRQFSEIIYNFKDMYVDGVKK